MQVHIGRPESRPSGVESIFRNLVTLNSETMHLSISAKRTHELPIVLYISEVTNGCNRLLIGILATCVALFYDIFAILICKYLNLYWISPVLDPHGPI